MLQKSGHLGILVHWALHRQEAGMQRVDQTHVHHIAGGGREKGIPSVCHTGQRHLHLHDSSYSTQAWGHPTGRGHRFEWSILSTHFLRFGPE
jgi:hypothetical protein